MSFLRAAAAISQRIPFRNDRERSRPAFMADVFPIGPPQHRRAAMNAEA